VRGGRFLFFGRAALARVESANSTSGAETHSGTPPNYCTIIATNKVLERKIKKLLENSINSDGPDDEPVDQPSWLSTDVLGCPGMSSLST
jgi:hypothetical protein